MFGIVYKGLDCIKCIFNEIQTPTVVKTYFCMNNKIGKRQTVPSEDSLALVVFVVMACEIQISNMNWNGLAEMVKRRCNTHF